VVEYEKETKIVSNFEGNNKPDDTTISTEIKEEDVSTDNKTAELDNTDEQI
jgi:hypothetical protein